MKYPSKGGSGDFKLLAAGTYTAICDRVIDIGMQEGSRMYPKARRQVYIRWEIPTERVEFERDGKKEVGPAVIGKMYTASMHAKANLRHDLESWRGKNFTEEQAADFDVASTLGKTCVISVTHSEGSDGKTYANVTAVGKPMKGTEKLIPEITPLLYDELHVASYAQLPEWLREKIDKQILPEKKAPEPEQDDRDWDDGEGPLEGGGYVVDSEIPF